MDSTYFLKEQLLRAEFCSVELQRGKCTREDNREEQNELQARRNVSTHFIIWCCGNEVKDQKC